MRPRNVALILVFLVAATASGQGPRPLDPLTEDEQNRARAAAFKDPRVQQLVRVGEAESVVDFIAYKAPGRTRGEDNAPQGRYADVTITLPAGGGGVRALVDLSANAVIEVVRVSESSVGLMSSDIQRAWSLAQQNDRVRGALSSRNFRVAPPGARARITADGNFVEGLRTVGDYPPGCNVDRCIVLLFREGLRHRDVGEVIVNLNTRQVYYQPSRRERR